MTTSQPAPTYATGSFVILGDEPNTSEKDLLGFH